MEPSDISVAGRTELVRYLPLPENEHQYGIPFCEQNGVIILKDYENEVFIGSVKEPDDVLIHRLQFYHKKRIVFFLIDQAELSAYLGRKISAKPTESKAGLESLDEKLLLDKIANDAPIVNLVNSILIDGIRAGASDIHIEVFKDVVVRYRIDGVLRVSLVIDNGKFPAISSRIKIMANLNIMERRLPQDGRISVNIGDTTVDMRVSIVPINRGESIVLRIFKKQGDQFNIKDLGFSPDCLSFINNLLKYPHGMILVTGPTGSGKTTTLNSMIREIKSDASKVIAIEDPVEYIIEGVDQIQINENIGLTFDSILRRILRQDPDVIMIGEIRDRETAVLSVRAALTGHLVLASLHTNDSITSINRLVNMGIEPFLLAAVLRGALAQRLVRRICPKCAKEYKINLHEETFLKSIGEQGSQFRHGLGCDYCGQTGYQGRFALAEYFSVSSDIEEMIGNGRSDKDLLSHLKKEGFRSILDRGIEAVKDGKTTIKELERTVVF